MKQGGRIWHEQLKAYIEKLGYVQCPRGHAAFRIGKWCEDDWVVCAWTTRPELEIAINLTILQRCFIRGAISQESESYAGC